MQPGASQEDVDAVIARVEAAGGEAFVSRGVTRTIIGLVGDVETFSGLNLRGMPGVAEVMRVSAPYKLVSRGSTTRRCRPCWWAASRSAPTPSR